MTKITDFTALSAAVAADVLPVVDLSDTTMAASGTTKKINIAELLEPGGAVSVLNPSYSGGADPAGSADSTSAFQAALNACPAGGAVLVPPGTYKITSTLTIPVGVWLRGLMGYRASSYSCLIKAYTMTTGSLIAFAAGTPCGGIADLVLDGTSLPAGTVHGIQCIGACKFGTIAALNVRNFTGDGINITASGGNPDGWLLKEISSHDNAGDGVHWDYCVDGQMHTFHLDHNTGSGLALGTMNNVTISHGKCQQNTNYGYALIGGFVRSNATLAHCFSENNSKDGWNFNTSGGGQGSIQLIGCSTRDEGTSGTSGSGWSGFDLTIARADILLVGCSNYITDSTQGPDYGLTLTNCTGNVNITACSFIGSVAAYSDGGGNTLVRWSNSTVSTGQNDATRTIAQAPAPPAAFTPSDPTGQSSATLVMMGLGSTCTYTPRGSGNVLATATGVYNDSTAETGQIAARYGTGTAPANNAAVTGTRFGGATDPSIGPTGANRPSGFAFSGLITGLTRGTAYWFDLAVSHAAGSGTCSVKNVSMTFVEQP